MKGRTEKEEKIRKRGRMKRIEIVIYWVEEKPGDTRDLLGNTAWGHQANGVWASAINSEGGSIPLALQPRALREWKIYWRYDCCKGVRRAAPKCQFFGLSRTAYRAAVAETRRMLTYTFSVPETALTWTPCNRRAPFSIYVYSHFSDTPEHSRRGSRFRIVL